MKKGFTLIELLAVIVILAIIALIATPIVLNIINDTKESAILRSADFYIDALENEIMLENMKLGGSFNPNVCNIDKDGNAKCDEYDTIEIKVDGEKPNGGSITFDNGKVKDINLTFSNNKVSMDSKGQLVLGEVVKVCTLTDDKDGDGVADRGDMITCSTESFHVISNDGTTISMLAEYNLDVGQIYNAELGEYEQITNPTGIQSDNAIGYTENSSTYYGLTLFSTTNYWYDDENDEYTVDTNYKAEGREYPFVYGDYKDTNGNQQNKIYPYVKSYEEYLIKEGVTRASATLISYEQLIELGCNQSCTASQYEWTYSTSYWTGSAYDNSGVWYVNSDGHFYGDYYHGGESFLGVRPVVNISASEI